MNKTLKIVSTNQLRRLNALSIAAGYNRNISDEGMAALDPSGLHVLKFVMVHRHAAGLPVKPHYRLMVLMKMSGRREPEYVTLDLSIGEWHRIKSKN